MSRGDRRTPGGAALFDSVFCSFLWPQFPGFSGGDIRDFHFLRQILTLCEVEFFALDAGITAHGHQSLLDDVSALHTAESIRRHRPELIDEHWLEHSWRGAAGTTLAPGRGWRRYHADVLDQGRAIGAYLLAAVQQRLDVDPPDFLFVSPQSNPLCLMLDTQGLETRTIMASYDVEAVRVERFAGSLSGRARLTHRLEAYRAARFERDNLSSYDGVIAVTELDRAEFVRRYGIEPDRVLALETGVDLDYHAFVERTAASEGGSGSGGSVVFVSSLAYEPNRQAAWRLIDQIMPLVRERRPAAKLVIVGQQPGERLRQAADGKRVLVTGTVQDVRPYLREADVACVPLLAGSGIKYKILEAMSAGVPLVCSGLSLIGMDVIPDEHVLVGETDAEIAAAIVRLLDDPDFAVALARRARHQVERSHGGDPSQSGLGEWLLELRNRPRRALPRPRQRGPSSRRVDMDPARTPEEDVGQAEHGAASEISPGLERAYRHARAGEFAARSRFGLLGVWGKRIVNRLTRHQISRQAEFNHGAVQAVHEIEQRLAGQAVLLDVMDARRGEALSAFDRLDRHFIDLEGRVGELKTTAVAQQAAIERLRETTRSHHDRVARLAARATAQRHRIDDLATTVSAQGRHLDEIGGLVAAAREKAEWIECRLTGEIENLAATVARVDRRVRPEAAMDQLAFADHFRGDEDLIRERVRQYTGVFGGADLVVDLGCGRGEFLDACRQAGITAYGVDADIDMVGRCSVKGLQAQLGDALEHLRSLGDESLGGLFSAQVIEHFGLAEILDLMSLAARKLKPGAPIVLETINPTSFYALRWYYADPSHRQPVAPETLKYLIQSAGFTLQELIFSSPPPERERLARLPDGAAGADLCAAHNDNVDKLNELLFGMQDYAVIATR